MSNPIVKIENLEYSYPGYTKKIIQKCTEEIYPGEILGVIGKNGVGKSTLMRIIASIHQPTIGNVFINGIDSLDFKKRREYLLNFIYLSHDKILLADFTIKDYFHVFSALYPNYSKEIESELIKFFHFEVEEKISALSTGNKMKVFLLFALATQVPMILIDEVTAVLDPENREDFFELVRKYSTAGITFIIATNIVGDLDGFASRVWFIDNGYLVKKSSGNLKENFKRRAA